MAGCIPAAKLCDGYPDCSDASDEDSRLCTIYVEDIPEIYDPKYDVRLGQNEMKYYHTKIFKPTLSPMIYCSRHETNILFSHQVRHHILLTS